MEKNQYLISKYDYFIFDCDGVLWNQDTEIPGAIDFISYLKKNGKEVTRSRYYIFNHAKKLGFSDIKGIGIELFFPACYAAAIYCRDVLKSKKAFVLGLEGIKTELEEVGIETVSITEEMISKSRINDDDFVNMTPDKSIDTVVSGYYPYWTYHLLCYASLLIRGGARYISTNTDNVYSTGVRNMPAGGSIMALISEAAGVKPINSGKPSKTLFDLLLSDQKLENEPKEKFIMIGDKIDTDITFGHNSGIDSCLVLSGVTREEDVEGLCTKFKIKPTYIAKSLKDLIPQ